MFSVLLARVEKDRGAWGRGYKMLEHVNKIACIYQEARFDEFA